MNPEIDYIQELVARGGPELPDYPRLNEWFAAAHPHLADGIRSPAAQAFRAAFGPAMSPATLQGLVCAHPHGYRGDFEIIDKIYVRHLAADPGLLRWDAYFHSQPAARAVRNRKDYFHTLLDSHAARCPGLRVLNVASGPGRCMFEWLSARVDSGAAFTCVDLDPDAIAYAAALNQDHVGRIEFQRRNAVRLSMDGCYDLVWAAGLFDYFSDRVFRTALRHLLKLLAPAGELVIGNFSEANPSRAYMEFGGWQLHHRSAAELEMLAIDCGIAPAAIRIGAEPEGVNLFLHINSPWNR
jgi:SAM-dependent methyltransferase